MVDGPTRGMRVAYRLFDDVVVQRLRSRVTDPRFAAAADRLRQDADDAARATRLATTGRSGWTHNYQCPKHSIALAYDESSPHAHRCPIDGETFTGQLLDEAWNALYFRTVLKDASAAAMGYAAFGETAFLGRARSILLGWSDIYGQYEPHGRNAGKGRCMGQSLDEAVWVVELGQAYDLVRPGLSTTDRERIEQSLFRPCGDHLLTQLRLDIHNIECWHLAGLATVGRLVGDDRYIRPAIEGEFSIHQQLARGFASDGWWWEGSPTYHYYTLEAVRALIDALGAQAVGGESLGRLRRALDAPLEIARADGSLPAMNDGWVAASHPGFVLRKTDDYEWATHTLADAHYAELLADCYAPDRPRASRAALLYGPDSLSKARPVARKSVCHESSGYGVLRHTTDAGEIWAMLKFGPHGGGHGHADKPALLLHAFDHRLSDDLGTPGYGAPLNGPWFRHTLAHNAPLLDQTPQPAVTGKLIRFDADDARDHALVDVEVAWDVDGPYKDAHVRRLLVLRRCERPYLIDAVRVRAPAASVIDLPLHHAGVLHTATRATPVAPVSSDGSYAYLTDWRSLGDRPTAEVRFGEVGSILSLSGTVFAASSPDNPSDHRRTTLFRRADGPGAIFVSIISPCTREPIKRSVRWIRTTADVAQFVIEGDGVHDAWAIASSIDDLSISDAHLRGATLRTHHLAD